MKIVLTSDLHVDYSPRNRELVDYLVRKIENISPDILVIAGDIAAGLDAYEKTLKIFSPLTCEKLAIAGNHDIWMESKRKLRKGIDSSRKYYELIPEICSKTGFTYLGTSPHRIGPFGFVGSIGWYDYSFRNRSYDDSITKGMYASGVYGHSMWMDKKYACWFRRRHDKVYQFKRNLLCKSDLEICEELAALLQSHLDQLDKNETERIIAVFHHLPFQDLVTCTNDPAWDFFSAFMGSARFGEILKNDRRVSHVLCGHTHVKKDLTIDRIRAVCNPVGYAHEWRSNDFKQVADDSLFVLEFE